MNDVSQSSGYLLVVFQAGKHTTTFMTLNKDVIVHVCNFNLYRFVCISPHLLSITIGSSTPLMANRSSSPSALDPVEGDMLLFTLDRTMLLFDVRSFVSLSTFVMG